ncbi:hypothetical protein WICMUC_003773 [Wickerhamomyces mucosus]|uniref:Uncharacterized protein n=1 Tax=Wickerhamomyces mucosus TaxID=1378264 RepID=A0A9P8PJI4_9ASCO|nr:hypothetical protein WICMUC_003773 [Wickerhamomyces mucosus]
MPHSDIVPIDEKIIYDELVKIRSELSILKKDRTQYLNSKDVLKYYNDVLKLVKELNSIRSSSDIEHKPNKVDQVTDDVFQLLSLFFITVGLINTAPATYASLTTVQRLLEHLNESKVYTHHDISPIKQRLAEITKIINDNKNSEDEVYLLKEKLNNCLKEYKEVEDAVQDVDDNLQSLFQQLVLIRRSILSLVSRTQFNEIELNTVITKLQNIEKHRDSTGKFKSLETDKVEEHGQNVLNGLLDDCNTLVSDLKAHNFKLDETLTPIYKKLISLKTTLEDLLVTRRWTLRQTDLYQYQKDLQSIDELRVQGKFPTQGKEDLKGQSVLLYLLKRNYAIIYKLLESSEPISESLQPIHNQLSTVRRCLLEVKRIGGINSSRELYPYQMKLASLDNLRVDGKFYVDGQIPEGQGTLNALLSECYDICQELKIEADERDDGKDKDEDEDEGDDKNLYDNDVYERDDDDDAEDNDDLEENDYLDDDEEEDYPTSYAPSVNEEIQS